MRRVRWSRWLIVAVVAAIGVYFVCDVVLLNYIESHGATQLAQALDAESATANLGSIPFLPSYVSGHIGSVTGRVSGATAPGGLRVDRIEVKLRDVTVSPRHLLSLARSRFAARTRVQAAQALVTVQLTEHDIHDFLVSKINSVASIRVSSAGVVVTFNGPPPAQAPTPTPGPRPGAKAGASPSPPPPSTARYLPVVQNSVLQLVLVSAVNVAPDLRGDAEQVSELVRLPPLPRSLQPDVRLGDGVIVLEASGSDVQMDVGEAQR